MTLTFTIDERQHQILKEAMRAFTLEAIRSYDLDTYMEFYMLLDCLEQPSNFPEQKCETPTIKLAA